MITYTPLKARDAPQLKSFFKQIGESKKNFRYFDTRSFEVLKNHILTIMCYLDDIPVGYGHIDHEEDTFWFGICISHRYTNQKIGSQLLHYMLDFADANNIDLCLTVDTDNHVATRLYEKNGFVEINRTKHIIKMHRKHHNG